METTAMIDFIKENVTESDRHEIQSAYSGVLKRVLKTKYGVYIEHPFSDNMTLAENWSNFSAWATEKFGSVDNFKLRQSFHYAFNRLWYNAETGELTGHPDNSCLIYLFRYLVTGVIDPDYAEAHRIKDGLGIKYETPSFGWVKFEGCGDVEIRRFKNGRIDFKGLSAEGKARLAEVSRIAKMREF